MDSLNNSNLTCCLCTFDGQSTEIVTAKRATSTIFYLNIFRNGLKSTIQSLKRDPPISHTKVKSDTCNGYQYNILNLTALELSHNLNPNICSMTTAMGTILCYLLPM